MRNENGEIVCTGVIKTVHYKIIRAKGSDTCVTSPLRF